MEKIYIYLLDYFINIPVDIWEQHVPKEISEQTKLIKEKRNIKFKLQKTITKKENQCKISTTCIKNIQNDLKKGINYNKSELESYLQQVKKLDEYTREYINEINNFRKKVRNINNIEELHTYIATQKQF